MIRSVPAASRSLFSAFVRPPGNRLYGLDVLRFCAASSVFMVHQALNARVIIGFPPTSSLVNEIGRYGFLGVHLFFVLSGFVILSTALRTDGPGFFAGRFARIFPTFAFCALISMLLVGPAIGRQVPSLGLYLANLTFMPLVFGYQWIDAVFWTLRYELQFYGFVFLLLATGQLRRKAWLMTWLWLGIAALQAATVLPDPLRKLFVADYAPLFIIGVGLYWCIEALSPARILLVITATVIAVISELPRIGVFEAGTQLSLNPWVVCGFIALLPLLLLTALRMPLARLGPLCYFLGGISYPLYLLHNNLSVALMPRLGLWLGLAIVFAACTFIFIVDERIRPSIHAALARLFRRTLLRPALPSRPAN
jgi:peptidoglycan/LPS O-acetylase OafA/YrhL